MAKSVTVRIKGAGIHRHCFRTSSIRDDVGDESGGGGRMDYHTVADLALT